MKFGPPWALSGNSVLVVGLGRSGLAAARLCAREGARLTVTDRRPAEEIDSVMLSGLSVTTRLGEHVIEDFTGADLIVVSPGVPLDIPELMAARQRKVPIIGEVELAASFLSGLPMIAITGTNGKSTTTALVGAILGADGRRPFTGGNLGKALSEAVFERSPPGSLALELSSFQLETCVNLRPDVAVLLNLAPDHLDRHGTFEAYAAAKKRILENQTPANAVVAWGDDEAIMALVDGAAARVFPFVRGEAKVNGAGFEDFDDAHSKIRIHLGGEEVETYQVRAAALRGPHNTANSAAAALACRLAGVSGAAVQHALDVFPGLPHRLERIRVRDGVEWINDSKATNPESAEVALLSFANQVIWIAGGRGKGSDYSSVVQAASGRVKALLTVGEEGPGIGRLAAGRIEVIEDCRTLEVAIERAARLARSGDVVLLSPACASYDQFEDFEHRGASFRRYVEALS